LGIFTDKKRLAADSDISNQRKRHKGLNGEATEIIAERELTYEEKWKLVPKFYKDTMHSQAY
jgi:hypothetical protein